MSINPIEVARRIEDRFRRYLSTTFDFPAEYAELRDQFRELANELTMELRQPLFERVGAQACPGRAGLERRHQVHTDLLLLRLPIGIE